MSLPLAYSSCPACSRLAHVHSCVLSLPYVCCLSLTGYCLLSPQHERDAYRHEELALMRSRALAQQRDEEERQLEQKQKQENDFVRRRMQLEEDRLARAFSSAEQVGA